MTLRRDLDRYERSLMPTNGNATATATASPRGFGIFGLTFVVLLVFKLAGMGGASWGLASLSWWWVFAPLAAGFLWVGFWLVAVLLFAFWASK
jgi:hypothetical protein